MIKMDGKTGDIRVKVNIATVFLTVVLCFFSFALWCEFIRGSIFKDFRPGDCVVERLSGDQFKDNDLNIIKIVSVGREAYSCETPDRFFGYRELQILFNKSHYFSRVSCPRPNPVKIEGKK